MIKNILFDLDDTLLDFQKAEKGALTKTLLHLGVDPKPETLSRYSELNAAQWKLLELGRITREQVKLRRYQLLFDELGVECSPAEAASYYETQLGIGHWFIDGAPELLTSLSPAYRLYLVSNGTACVQKSRIESAGIAVFFEHIFISQEIGFNKPDIKFFDHCFSKIPDFRRDETIIVGDSLSSDVKGGKNAGIAAVWFNPHKSANDSGVNPDYEIRSLSELPPLLEKL
jgi:2-haloacid dehalogenase